MNEKIQSSLKDDTLSVSIAKESNLDKSVFFIILSLGFLIPLFFIPQAMLEVSKSVLISTLVTIAFFLWLIARMKDGKFVFPKSLLLLSGFALPVAFLASGIFSEVPRVSLLGLGYETGTFATILTLFLLMFLTSVFFQQQTRIFYLYSSLFVSFVIAFFFQVGVITLASFSLLPAKFLSAIPTNVIGKWTDLAAFFGLVFMLSLVAIELIALRKPLKIFLSIVIGLSLISLVLINFSLLWIIIGFLSLVISVYALSFSPENGKEGKSPLARKFPVISFGILLISLIFVLGSGTVNDLLSRFIPINIPTETIRPSWQGTFEVGKHSLLKDSIFGIGPNRFSNAWLSYKPDGVNQSTLWNVDFDAGAGLIPTFAITTGVIGIIAWLFFLGLFLYRSFTAVLSLAVGRISHYLLFSSFLGAAYLWIVSIFYVPNIVIFSLAFLMTGVFIAALVETGIGKNYNFSFLHDPRTGFISVLILVLFILGTITGGYVLFQKFLSVVFFQNGLNASKLGDIDNTLSSISRAASFSEYDVYYRNLSAVNIARLNSILSQKGVSQDTVKAQFQSESRFAITNALRARDLDPTNYQNWVALGNAYETLAPFGVQDAHEEAKKAFDTAISLNPKSPALLLNRARLDLEKDKESAKTYIAKALTLKSDYTDAIFTLSQIQAGEGNLASAIASVEVASVISPNDVGIFFQLGFLRYKNKDWQGAISAFERAIELSPSYSNARYFLGLAYDKAGRTGDAINQFQTIQTLNPDNSEVRGILSNLRAGRDPLGTETPAQAPEKRKEPPLKER
ncbi:MAG: tetratricopeptide repeat protein [Candidatus Yonathbacteria bacterium]|nr:tetratricopeptide repeat protein [Candidatus Yonathbacteria bacterium]